MPTALPEGSYSVEASVTDAAGNSATATDNGNTVDTTAPAIAIDTVADDSHVDDSEDNSVTLSGTTTGVEAGQSVSVSVVDANGTEFYSGTATVQDDGTWRITGVNMSDWPDEATYTVHADVSDAAGNAATQATCNFTTEDTTAPTIADQTFTYTENQSADAVVATLADNTDVVSYTFDNGTQTSDDGYFTIDDSGEIRITADGVAAAINDFEVDPNSSTYTVVAKDEAGNAASFTLTLNAQNVNEAPTAALDNYNVDEGDDFAASSVLSNDSDPENDTLSVLRIAGDANGANAQIVDGSNSFTTALGGTVVMNTDGTFTYTAPVLDHSGNDVQEDFIYYQASDGSNTSDWVKVSLDVEDTAPVARDDSDSVGSGGSASGNVITGDGGLNADIIGADGTEISAVIYDGVRYDTFDADGNIVINADNGKLTMNRDGSYTYDSTNTGDTTVEDSFTYEIHDSDGDVSTAGLTIRYDVDPVAVDDNATVYESALSTGTDADSDAEVVTGNLLSNDLGVSNTTTITDIDGNTPDNGMITVTTTNGVLEVNATTGEYTYTLNSASQNGDNAVDSFTYTLTDSSDNATSSATLNVKIVDDSPVGTNIVQNIQDGSSVNQTINLVIVLDRSGSMSLDLEGNKSGDENFNADQVRMDIAKQALTTMFDSFDDLGNINIKFIVFDDKVSESAWFVDDKKAANEYLEGITPDGNTYYDKALEATMDGYNPPEADKTLLYFISDGDPVNAVDQTLQDTWENFLQNNIDIAFGIGITNDVSLDSLKPIAYPNTNADGDSEPYAIQVLDAMGLKQTLLDAVGDGIAMGDATVASTGTGTSGIVPGADGGHVLSVVVDGVTHTYDSVDNVIETITTARGGIFEIDYETGKYIYTINPKDTVAGEEEVFAITVVDGDGDTKTIDLTIHLDYVANIDANRENIITNASEGTSLDIDFDMLTANDNLSSSMSVTDVTAESGTDLTVDTDRLTLSDVTDGESFTYTISDGSDSESAKDVVILQNSDVLNGTIDDDILIARQENDYPALVNVDAVVMPGYTSRTENQYGFKFVDSMNALSITRITIDLQAGTDTDAVFDPEEPNAFDLHIGTNTKGIDETDVTFIAEDGPNLSMEFVPGSFTAGDEFWFSIDTDGLGKLDKGEDFGKEKVAVTITLSDGSTLNGIYETQSDGSSTIDFSVGNALMGNEGDDLLIGNDNNELLDGGEGNDKMYAGGGDDTLVYDKLDSIIDGGEGNDVLFINESIDFSALIGDKIKNIETISLENGSSEKLSNLTLDDVINMTDGDNTLVIEGESSDEVDVPDTPAGYNVTVSSEGGYDVYTYSSDNDPTVILKIDQDVQHS